MNEISKLKRKIRSLQKKQTELCKQESELQDEVYKMESVKHADRIRKRIHKGDIKIINRGVTNYHCDPLKIYEILSVSEYTCKRFHNNVSFTYQSFGVKVREFTIHLYDSDMECIIEVKSCSDLDTLAAAKNMSKEDFEEFKATLMLNPQTYENSKWDPKRKE